ncbi:MAG: YgiQ family radical SAM protein [Blautia sp.]|nr:YgiQ family radical SAM protein [Blautia sp.]MDY3998661.1 YgiQ family radical SAM protein [Blautia sp.]
MQKFLPVNSNEMKERGWDQVDFVYVTGDAYVDHSSFGAAIISRLLESRGYRVGMIPQPDWHRKESIQVFGEPRLGFLVTAGNMDSMVNHYSVSGKRRQKDSYSPGGRMGLRPDMPTVVYSNLIRQTYKNTPIILGGIEASLRRLAHYDYWQNKIRRSVLMDSGADLISYGMGEHSIVEIADALSSGIPVQELTYIPGTVYKCRDLSRVYDPIVLPSYEELQESKKAYADSFAMQYKNTDSFTARPLAESYGTKGYVIQNPPSKPLTSQEMDDVYDLPYTGKYHPMYEKDGGIPALEEVKFSLTSNRGCFGGCSFCALTFHQGRILQTRSHESILREAVRMTEDPDFKGYIHDVGGPTADFRQPSCEKQLTKGVCQNRQCLFPDPCRNLNVDHSDYVALLKKLRNLPGVKKVFIRSGVRFDYVMADGNPEFLRELVEHHVSGQLRVAPEHVSDQVLRYMGKPQHEVYESFLRAYEKANRKTGMQQYAVPYFMSSHPGCTMKEAVKLAEYVRDLGFTPEQVQDFYPTPSTLSTCMYYTGIHPLTKEKVYVPRNPHEKAIQRALMQYKNPANRELVLEGLKLAGRMDLVGYGKQCLLRPDKYKSGPPDKNMKSQGRKKTIRNVHKKKAK